MYVFSFKGMKNVTCFKLSIDRSKAQKKMGTLKDVSLFGNFTFPTDGEYGGGILAKSMAGVGRELRKTKAQVQKIASRDSCLVGATGSSISNELPQTLERDSQVSPSSELYSIRFISHALNMCSFLLWRSTLDHHLFFHPPVGML